jgi:hypothetical protein
VTAPASRVVASSQSLGLGGIKDALDPAAHAGGCFSLDVHIGCTTESTSSVSMSPTGFGRRAAA